MNRRYQLGVMQGRLLPKYLGRYQAHPVNVWQAEFSLAASLGLDSIEFILDYDLAEKNPLLHEAGVCEIVDWIAKTGVRVRSVCADYFMESPFHNNFVERIQRSQQVLCQLLSHGTALGLETIVIPCVDQASLNDNPIFFQELNENLGPALAIAEELGITLALETDLAPDSFVRLLDMFNSPYIGVNYDLGNSASFGYGVVEEWQAYGAKVVDVHLKDRIRGGGSVLLGQGDADFDSLFATMDQINYDGIIIMQAFRDDEGLSVFKQQLEWILQRWEGKGKR